MPETMASSCWGVLTENLFPLKTKSTSSYKLYSLKPIPNWKQSRNFLKSLLKSLLIGGGGEKIFPKSNLLTGHTFNGRKKSADADEEFAPDFAKKAKQTFPYLCETCFSVVPFPACSETAVSAPSKRSASSSKN